MKRQTLHASSAVDRRQSLTPRSHPRERTRSRAFTLIELTLAVALAGMLMLAVLSLSRSTTASRQRLTAQMRGLAAQRAVMDRIADELRSALAYRFLGLGMEGGLEAIQFPTTRVPGPGVWAQRSLSDEPMPPEHDLMVVGYRLRMVDEDGQRFILGLERTQQQIVTARQPEEGDQITAALLSRDIRLFRLRYFGPDGWSDAWSGGSVPAAVEITIGDLPLPEDIDPAQFDPATYPGRLQQRIVMIPTGAQAIQAEGSQVRGLGR